MPISSSDHDSIRKGLVGIAANASAKRISFEHGRRGGDRARLSYLKRGDRGTPVILLHGFASSAKADWVETGWLDAFCGAGLQVLAPDLRGHGLSAKPHSAAAYGLDALAADVAAMFALHCERPACLIGYSMGAHIALWTALKFPGIVDRIVLGGLGANILETVGLPGFYADALECADPESIKDSRAAAMRRYAVEHGNDLAALAACLRGQHMRFEYSWLRDIPAPTLVVTGTHDRIAGLPDIVSAALPHGSSATIAGASHASTLADARFRELALSHILECR